LGICTGSNTEGSPNLSVYRVRTVAYRTLPFSARDRFGRPREPYSTKHEPFFVISMLKSIIWWNLLEKREPYREAFLYKKAIKTDICAVRFALTALFSLKK
jgi:hypothetical protein